MPQVAGIADQQYLSEQYRDATNLGARISLHQRFSTNKYGWQRWVFEQFNLPPECRILELGCGSGDLWFENLSCIPNGWEITLSDSSAGMLQQAQQTLSKSHRPFKFEVVDAQSIPLASERFDAVIANHMLYHVPDKARVLEEIHRVLRPGGRFYTSTVGQRHLRELTELAGRFDAALASWGWEGLSSETFTLENGAAQISQRFTNVTLHRYEDALVITDSAPLIGYMLSGRIKMTSDQRVAFAEFVKQELEFGGGAFHVTKDSGLFKAIRDECRVL